MIVKTSTAYCVAIILVLGSSCGSKTMEERARAIHEKALTVDTHTDTPGWLVRGGFDLAIRHDHSQDGSCVDFPRMKEGGLDAVFMAAFVGQGPRDGEGNRKAIERVTRTIDSIHASLARCPEIAGMALTPQDAYRLEKEGKRAVFIGIENGYGIGSDIGNIRRFYDLGARYITLCHVKNNDICDSSTDTAGFNGLSGFGKEVVKEMNRRGMMIDVSHISDSSFYGVIGLSQAPVIASHSCARAICDNPRNLSDGMLKALADKGGVIQLCILSDYVKKSEPYPERDSAFKAIRIRYRDFRDLTPEEDREAERAWRRADSLFPRRLATVAEAVDHIDHIVGVAGIDHVGIGTDFDGGGGLADCRDAGELGNITLELVRRGYSEKEIRKIWGGNIMRVMREVQSMAGSPGSR